MWAAALADLISGPPPSRHSTHCPRSLDNAPSQQPSRLQSPPYATARTNVRGRAVRIHTCAWHTCARSCIKVGRECPKAGLEASVGLVRVCWRAVRVSPRFHSLCPSAQGRRGRTAFASFSLSISTTSRARCANDQRSSRRPAVRE